MKRADVHLVNVRNDAAIRQFVCNSCDKFFCSFLRESSNKNIFRLYATFFYKVNRTLNERIGLAGSRSRSDEDGTFGGSYRFPLSLICISKIKHIGMLHPFSHYFFGCVTPVWHDFHDIRYVTLKGSTYLQ